MSRKKYKIILAILVALALLLVTVGVTSLVRQRSDTAKHKGTESTWYTSAGEDLMPAPTQELKETPEPTSVPKTQPGFEISFFDVGQADSALVCCDGHYMLIDGGNSGSSSFLYSYLEQHGITYLDYIVCSHAHSDHAGGLAGALNYAQVGTAYAPVTEYDSRAFDSFVKYLNEQGKEIRVPEPGECVMLGSATVSFLGPVDMSLAELNLNNSSIILRIEYGATSFVFTGDAEAEEELSVIESGAELKSTLLKVGHHGSETSSSEEFMKAVNPDYAVISVGKDNDYGHPHEAALERISAVCPNIYRTDQLGEIICRSDGENLSFSFEKTADAENDK